MKFLSEEGGRFFRGNLHTHSNRSDGALPPDEVARIYRAAGYDFLCLSDHFLERFDFPVTDTSGLRAQGFTTLLGAELHAPANSHGELWHILAVGLPADFAPTGPDEDGVALAARAREAGAFVGIAHPEWSGLSEADGEALAGAAHAVEIYNFTCDVECARPSGSVLLDGLLNAGHRLLAFAADDAHFRWPDGGGGWVMVQAEANEPEPLLAALKAGAFYSSRGPMLREIAIEGEDLHVACSPVSTVSVVGRGTRSATVQGRQISRASVPVKSFFGDWLRVVVTDAAGRQAWSNPVWL